MNSPDRSKFFTELNKDLNEEENESNVKQLSSAVLHLKEHQEKVERRKQVE